MKSTLLLLVAFAAVMVAAAEPPKAKTAPTKNDLRKLFENTEWIAGKDASSHAIFYRDGKMTGTIFKWWNFYTVEGPNILRIYAGDPTKDRQAAFFQYRVNVPAMIAEFDGPASTRPGGGKPLKYAGPAPKK